MFIEGWRELWSSIILHTSYNFKHAIFKWSNHGEPTHVLSITWKVFNLSTKYNSAWKYVLTPVIVICEQNKKTTFILTSVMRASSYPPSPSGTQTDFFGSYGFSESSFFISNETKRNGAGSEQNIGKIYASERKQQVRTLKYFSCSIDIHRHFLRQTFKNVKNLIYFLKQISCAPCNEFQPRKCF